MIAIFEQVLILFTFCLTGYVLCKTKLLDSTHSKPLSVLLIYVFFPCMSFNTFSSRFTLAYLREKGTLILISMALLFVSVMIAKLLNRFLKGDSYEKNVNEYSMSTANFAYMGYPLAEGVFGSAGMLDCMMFGLPLSIYIGTVGYNMLTAGKGEKTVWEKIFTPSLIGILLGCTVGITGLKLPQTVFDIAKMSSNCVAPVSMLLTGMAISQFSLKELFSGWRVYFICAVRLILMPLLVWSLIKLCQLDFALAPAVLLFAMPCGMNTIVYPKLVGKDCRMGAASVLVSTVLSMLTIPLCLYFLLPQ